MVAIGPAAGGLLREDDRRPLGCVGPLDLSSHMSAAAAVEVGRRSPQKVTEIDLDQCRARLSVAATEDAELWEFLSTRRFGEIVSGRGASIESFGVFVELDDGPEHPAFQVSGSSRFPNSDGDPLAHLGIGAAEAETLTADWSAVRVVDLDVLRCYALRP
ncbi:hypothetical protein ACH4NS_32240 [Streptomyces mutabilis]|uniref:hypothetical protein n=1 Tax=Streptomyces mutabilis TaxID=67332 RepID=UPI0037A2C277